MPTFSIAALSGSFGAVAAHLTYVRSNTFILGDAIRRGRHPLWDPAYFDGLGLVWGVLAGILAARLFAASPGKALIVGLGATVLGIGVVGGATTFKRYQALPREPMLARKHVILEIELRAPVDRVQVGELPARGELGGGLKNSTRFALSQQTSPPSEGRIVLSGSVPLEREEENRLVSFEEQNGLFVNFLLPLSAKPTDADVEWTDWYDSVNAGSGLPSTQVFQIRYRVKFGPGG